MPRRPGGGPPAGWSCRWATPAPPGVNEHFLYVAQRRTVRVHRASGPVAVRAQVPGRGGVRIPGLQKVVEGGAVRRVGHPDQRLDAPVEVAVHHVRAAQPDLRLAAVAEDEHPRVLQEAPEDAADPDVLAQAGDPRAQRADAADPDVDRHTRLGGAVEGVDDGLVHHGVDLDTDIGRAAGLLVGDLLGDALYQ